MDTNDVVIFKKELKDDIYVAIPLEEYKDLLITKGKYEELKSKSSQVPWTVNPKTNITYRYNGKEYQWPPAQEERKVTCEE